MMKNSTLYSETNSSSSYTILNAEEAEAPVCLVIDDDKICRDSLVAMLTEVNVRTAEASSVREAITAIHQLKDNDIAVDVVFLDYMLAEDSTGLDFLKIIRANQMIENSLIVVISGKVDMQVANECFKYGILNFMKKPITKQAFYNEFARMRDHLESIRCPLKDYIYLKKIGSSSKSLVTLVKSRFTNKLYALRQMSIDKENISGKELKELNVYETIKCPTVIEVVEHSIEDNMIYIIQEVGLKGALAKRIDRKRKKHRKFRTDSVIDWMAQMLLGILVIHENNLIHRGIKPSNLFICENNVMKIGDTGVLREASRSIEENDDTICYRAPETFLSNYYTNKSDIWSLGVVLFELITLKRPFSNIENYKIIEQISKLDRIPLNIKCDDRLMDLCNEMLVVDANQRLSAKELFRKHSFLSDRIKHMFETKVLDDDNTYTLLLNITDPYISINTEGETHMTALANDDMSQVTMSNRGDKLSSTERGVDLNPIIQLLSDFKNAVTIDSTTTKSPFGSSYLGYGSNTNAIKGSDIELSADDYNLNEKDLTSLLDNKFLLNLSNPNTPDFDNKEKTFYEVRIFENAKIDNSIVCQIDTEEKIKNPADLTIACLRKAEDAFAKIERSFNDVNASEISKVDVIASRENLEFFYLIKKLVLLDLESYTEAERLACILNIYQTMNIHFNIKSIITEDSHNSDNFIERFKSLFSSKDRTIDICYQIGKQTYTMAEMKHVVVRKNKRPLDAYFRLAKSSDPRIGIIKGDEELLLKLHMVCLDINWYNKLITDTNTINNGMNAYVKVEYGKFNYNESKNDNDGEPSSPRKKGGVSGQNKKIISNTSVSTLYSKNTTTSSAHPSPLIQTGIDYNRIKTKHTYFKADSVYKQLDNYCNHFVTNNVKIEDKYLLCPGFFKEYMGDFSYSENEMIKRLVTLWNKKDVRPLSIMKAINNKDLTINYY